MKFTTGELSISEHYAVLYWQGEWHIVKVDAISPGAQNLSMRWIAVGFASFEKAQAACERFARDAQITADRVAAGLCACGLPFDEHVFGKHTPSIGAETTHGKAPEGGTKYLKDLNL